jgi:hypothetical protein
MFTCANCRKEKPDSELGAVGLLGNIGFLLIAKVPWWPSTVCRGCSKQVRLFGMACIAIFAALAGFYMIIAR